MPRGHCCHNHVRFHGPFTCLTTTVSSIRKHLIVSFPSISFIGRLMCSFSICVTALASRERSSDAETHDVSAEVGRIAFSGSRSQQPRRKDPRAAAINSEAIALAVLRFWVARRGLVRAPVGGNTGVAVVVTVLGPLPNVPCHVVKGECVRRLRAHRMVLAMVAKKTAH